MADHEDPLTPSRAPLRWFIIAIVVGCVVMAGFLIGPLFNLAQNLVSEMQRIDGVPGTSTLLLGALVLYAALIALPFMPGIELGVAILMIQGAQSAPLVYVATVTGLMTAFLVGRLVPLSLLYQAFAKLGLRRASNLIQTIRTSTPTDRLKHQRERLPNWLARLTIDYRYVTIGVLLNVPGTFAIGGGGGILLVVGLSRLFNGWLVLLTLMIATLPVPLTVWIMGTQVFQ